MTRHLVLFAVAGVALAASRAGYAAELAGIALSQPVTMSECAVRQHDYLPDDYTTCFKLPQGTSRDPYADAATPPVNGRIIVNVARSDRPSFMSGSDADVVLHGGSVTSIAVRTHGTRGESGDFRALKDVFGEASPRHVTVPWNVGGNGPAQTQTSLRADWTLPSGDTVYFSSGEFGAYFGLVRLQTSAAGAHPASH